MAGKGGGEEGGCGQDHGQLCGEVQGPKEAPWAPMGSGLRCGAPRGRPPHCDSHPRGPHPGSWGTAPGPLSDLGKGPCAHSGFSSGAETAGPAQAPAEGGSQERHPKFPRRLEPPCSDGAQAPAAEPRAGPGSQAGGPFRDSPQNCVSVRPSGLWVLSPGLRAPARTPRLAPWQRLPLAVLPAAALALPWAWASGAWQGQCSDGPSPPQPLRSEP